MPHCPQSDGSSEHHAETSTRRKLESLLRESRARDREDTDSFTVRALLQATREGLDAHLPQVSTICPGMRLVLWSSLTWYSLYSLIMSSVPSLTVSSLSLAALPCLFVLMFM